VYACVFMYVRLFIVVHASAEMDSEDSFKAASTEQYCDDIFIHTYIIDNAWTHATC
jgi:hypothetical protein